GRRERAAGRCAGGVEPQRLGAQLAERCDAIPGGKRGLLAADLPGHVLALRAPAARLLAIPQAQHLDRLVARELLVERGEVQWAGRDDQARPASAAHPAAAGPGPAD